MLRTAFLATLMITFLLGVPGPASAQETGTPLFKAPYRAFETHEFGVAVSDPATLINFATEGFYRYGQGRHDLSLRAGIADGTDDLGSRVLIGGDFRTRFIDASETVPLDGALTVGFGTSIGDGPDRFYVPIGVSMGRRLIIEGGGTTFVPYLHPVIVPSFGGGGEDVGFALGLGTDVRFAENWAVRVSGGIGDIDGIGVSLTRVR